LRNQGSCPHHRTRSIYWSAIAADLVLGSKALSPEEEQRLRAQLAFLGYTLARPTFISPERGFKANPNMTSSARGMLGIVACTIPQQPNAKNWAELSIGEMKEELETWCGPNGGWLEAPHYMTVSMDGLMSLALALRGKGFTDEAWHLHPSFKAAVHWLAKISTPPDLRLDGHRHMPAIGNTYLGEPSCLFGWMATVWQEADPAYARNMQWMWLEHGKPLTPGIGGAYPGFQGYETLLLNTDLPAAPPRWQSELFPSAGAVFRAHFPAPLAKDN